VGVSVAIVLLTFHGWSAGRAAQLRGWQLAGATAIAAALGLIMVVLKNVVIHYLH
jgi:Na+/H+ antiporter NhaA